MDDRPIDPFNPYARRYSPQEWPTAEPAIDDTQDIPVIPVPRTDDTQEVPVVPRQAAASPSEPVPPAQVSMPPHEPVPPPHVAAPQSEPVPPAQAAMPPHEAVPVPHEPAPAVPPEPASSPPPQLIAPGQFLGDGPPQWPTGVREPTTAIPAPPAAAPPYGPELTVPPGLVPPRPGGKPVRKPLIAVGAGVAVLVALVGIVFFMMTPDSEPDGPDTATASSTAPEESGEDAGSPADESKSPSKNPKPESDKTSEPEPTEDAGDDPPPEQKLTVPSRPTRFGAWFAGDGTYKAKWGRPANDGGSDILAYILGDCQGNDLAYVDSNTFRATVYTDHLDCMSIYAVNGQGTGEHAQHQITNNP